MNHSKIQRIYKRLSILTLLTLGLSVSAFASDPITVISNLSSFIFGLIKAWVSFWWAGALCRWVCPSRATMHPREARDFSLWLAALWCFLHRKSSSLIGVA